MRARRRKGRATPSIPRQLTHPTRIAQITLNCFALCLDSGVGGHFSHGIPEAERETLRTEEVIALEALRSNIDRVEPFVVKYLNRYGAGAGFLDDDPVEQYLSFEYEKTEAIIAEVAVDGPRQPLSVSFTISGQLAYTTLWFGKLLSRRDRQVWLELDANVTCGDEQESNIDFSSVRLARSYGAIED